MSNCKYNDIESLINLVKVLDGVTAYVTVSLGETTFIHRSNTETTTSHSINIISGIGKADFRFGNNPVKSNRYDIELSGEIFGNPTNQGYEFDGSTTAHDELDWLEILLGDFLTKIENVSGRVLPEEIWSHFGGFMDYRRSK